MAVELAAAIPPPGPLFGAEGAEKMSAAQAALNPRRDVVLAPCEERGAEGVDASGPDFWREPRTNMVLQILAYGLIVQGLNYWPIPGRLKGILNLLLAVILLVLVLTTPLVLHPEYAARTAESLAIQSTFFSLYLISLTAAALIALKLHAR